MITDRRIYFLLAPFFTIMTAGCSYNAWYAGLQEQQRQECYKNTSSSDVQRCLERVNSMTFEQYKVQRERSLKKTEPQLPGP